jgi:hypothetical protein
MTFRLGYFRANALPLRGLPVAARRRLSSRKRARRSRWNALSHRPDCLDVDKERDASVHSGNAPVSGPFPRRSHHFEMGPKLRNEAAFDFALRPPITQILRLLCSSGSLGPQNRRVKAGDIRRVGIAGAIGKV